MEMTSIYICGFLGGYEWIVIILAIVLLFGGRKIPELMKGLGQGMKEFKKAKNDINKEVNDNNESSKG